jgi:hypothetical protein
MSDNWPDWLEIMSFVESLRIKFKYSGAYEKEAQGFGSKLSSACTAKAYK